jgi:hypothetical protein
MLSNPDVKIYRKKKKRMSRQRLAACVPHMCTVRNMRRNDTKPTRGTTTSKPQEASFPAVPCCAAPQMIR